MFKFLKYLFFIFTIVFFIYYITPKEKIVSQNDQQIVVSIKPIHGLVCALTRGILPEPILLLDSNASPHTHTLSPKQVAILKEASLFIWIGKSYEENMGSTVEKVILPLNLLTLEQAQDVVLLEPRRGDSWGYPLPRPDHKHHLHDHDHDHDHFDNLEHNHKHDDSSPENSDDHEADHHEHPKDGHLWLSIRNAKLMAKHIYKELASRWPNKELEFKSNLKKLTDELNKLESEIEEILQPHLNKPYLIYHDGTQYFDNQFATRAIGSVIREPGIPTSPAHQKIIRSIMTSNPKIPIFVEPQFKVDLSIYGQNISFFNLDYIGTQVQPGPQAYQEIMLNFAKSLSAGFGK
jgi:zinc transport system substrate-binding protein